MQANGAQAETRGAKAAVDRIVVDIEDCKLKAPRDGRIQYWIIVLVYGVSITNTIDSFLVNQLQMASPPRIFLLGMMAVVYAGETIMLLITKWLVYPLVAILFFISIYLIPSWNTAIFNQTLPSWEHMSLTFWITLPVIVFSFNHAPIISFFSLAQKRDYKELAEPKASQILLRTTIMLWFFVMFFVFSCVLSLSPTDLAMAKKENISILSYIANHNDSPFLSYFGPIVALCAIGSSFFGHYTGTVEGLTGLVNKYAEATKISLSPKKVKICVAIFMLVTSWGVAVFNPNVLQVIESFSGPLIAIILFIMPMYAIHKVPAMRKYSGKMSNTFIVVTGLIAISAAFYRVFSVLH